jgi:hypothetical protein
MLQGTKRGGCAGALHCAPGTHDWPPASPTCLLSAPPCCREAVFSHRQHAGCARAAGR